MVGESSSDGMGYKGMFWDAANILGAGYMHIFTFFFFIYSLFKNNLCPGCTYILIWGLLHKYILIKIITKNIPFKNTTNYY